MPNWTPAEMFGDSKPLPPQKKNLPPLKPAASVAEALGRIHTAVKKARGDGIGIERLWDEPLACPGHHASPAIRRLKESGLVVERNGRLYQA